MTVGQSETSAALPNCDPRRYSKGGVIRCPHGCVTECEKRRRELLLASLRGRSDEGFLR